MYRAIPANARNLARLRKIYRAAMRRDAAMPHGYSDARLANYIRIDCAWRAISRIRQAIYRAAR